MRFFAKCKLLWLQTVAKHNVIQYFLDLRGTSCNVLYSRLKIIFLFAWSNFAIHCLCLRSNFNNLISNSRWFPALTVGGSDNSARPHARGPGTSLAGDRLRSSNVGGNCFFKVISQFCCALVCYVSQNAHFGLQTAMRYRLFRALVLYPLILVLFVYRWGT